MLGQSCQVIVKNPSVELEPSENREISPAEIAEHLERQNFIESDVIVSQDVTSDKELQVSEEQKAHLEGLIEMDALNISQDEINEKMKSNSYQVSRKFSQFLTNAKVGPKVYMYFVRRTSCHDFTDFPTRASSAFHFGTYNVSQKC